MGYVMRTLFYLCILGWWIFWMGPDKSVLENPLDNLSLGDLFYILCWGLPLFGIGGAFLNVGKHRIEWEAWGRSQGWPRWVLFGWRTARTPLWAFS
jgi:hypothetical protein